MKSSQEEKKMKELSFPPLIHTQTTQKLVIFEKIACKTRLIYDEEEKKREGNRYITNSGRDKDVSHRRAWHIRMTATSSLVLSERGNEKKKKNSPYEPPSLPTLIKNPDDERDAERVWRRTWEPYPSCGVSDTNASG